MTCTEYRPGARILRTPRLQAPNRSLRRTPLPDRMQRRAAGNLPGHPCRGLSIATIC